MENIHFSIQDLIEIMSFTICLIYLLQIYLTNLIPPTSNKYFVTHFGLLVVILLGFVTRNFLGESLLFYFLPLLILVFTCTSPILFYFAKSIQFRSNVEANIYQPIFRAILIGEIGFVLFLSGWLSSVLIPPETSQAQSLIDSFILICLFALLPVQSMYYTYNSIKFRDGDWLSEEEVKKGYERMILNLLRMLIFGYLGLMITVVLGIFLEKLLFNGLPYVSVLVYLLFVMVYIQLKKTSTPSQPVKEEVAAAKNELNEDKQSIYLILEKNLIQLMEEEKLYLNKSLSINDVAAKLGTNSKYLSETINTRLRQSFVTFINGYRVTFAKELLKNPDNNHFTLETIGRMAGFNSKSSFNSSFKKFEGMTPSKYKVAQQKVD